MTHFTVLFDACVFYPAPLRDLLMHLALTDLFRARWTDTIHDEWIRSVLANRPDLRLEQLQRTRELMNAHIRGCLVLGYEELIPALSLPDPNDRHVLAAAIRAGANMLVTYNLRDFPEKLLQTYGIQAIHPDDFIVCQMDLAPNIVCLAVKRHRASLRNPPKSIEDYFQTLLSQELVQTVDILRKYSDLL